MRELILAKLIGLIAAGAPIPQGTGPDDLGWIVDPEVLHAMTDEELLNIYDLTIGFGG